MRVVVRLAEQHRVGSQDQVVDSTFDPVIFDGDLDLDEIRAARRANRPIVVNDGRYLVRDLNINSVVGETVAEIEVDPYLG